MTHCNELSELDEITPKFFIRFQLAEDEVIWSKLLNHKKEANDKVATDSISYGTKWSVNFTFKLTSQTLEKREGNREKLRHDINWENFYLAQITHTKVHQQVSKQGTPCFKVTRPEMKVTGKES